MVKKKAQTNKSNKKPPPNTANLKLEYFIHSFSEKVLDSNLCKLTASLEEAVAEKVQRQDDVNRTNKTIELTNRLVRRLEVRRFSPDVLAAVSFKIFEMFC